MDETLYNKLNEAYSISVRLVVPPPLSDFRQIMLNTFVIPFAFEEFNNILEKEGENTLILKIGVELNERIMNVLSNNPQFNTDRHFALIDNIHASAMDFLLKDNSANDSQKLAGVDFVKDKIDNIFFLANKKPDKYTKRYFKILEENKKRLLETPSVTATNEYLHYWPHESEKLKLLIDDLKNKNFIEIPPDYISTFKHKEIHKRPKIKWIGESEISLFVLLFYIYGKSLEFNGENILDIGWKLFDCNENLHSTRQYFNSIKNRFDDASYIEKKHKSIQAIVMKLDLKGI